MTTTTRCRRQRVSRSDGSVAVQTKPPRADVLWYRAKNWPSVLVRRTHDVELAREMAERRWSEIGEDRPVAHHRVGWWKTLPGGPSSPDAAEDQHGRGVQWCEDTEHAAGPGVEFRP